MKFVAESITNIDARDFLFNGFLLLLHLAHTEVLSDLSLPFRLVLLRDIIP